MVASVIFYQDVWHQKDGLPDTEERLVIFAYFTQIGGCINSFAIMPN